MPSLPSPPATAALSAAPAAARNRRATASRPPGPPPPRPRRLRTGPRTPRRTPRATPPRRFGRSPPPRRRRRRPAVPPEYRAAPGRLSRGCPAGGSRSPGPGRARPSPGAPPRAAASRGAGRPPRRAPRGRRPARGAARARPTRTSGGTRGASPSAISTGARRARGAAPLGLADAPLVLGLALSTLDLGPLLFLEPGDLARLRGLVQRPPRGVRGLRRPLAVALVVDGPVPPRKRVLEGLAGRSVGPLRHVRALADAREVRRPQGCERLHEGLRRRQGPRPAPLRQLLPVELLLRAVPGHELPEHLVVRQELRAVDGRGVRQARGRDRALSGSRAARRRLLDRDLLAPVREQLP